MYAGFNFFGGKKEKKTEVAQAAPKNLFPWPCNNVKCKEVLCHCYQFYYGRLRDNRG
uniref:Uncharacterized protein n=1 Tax=Arundo donax TaxID=35708 RepID=A0A0A9HJS0_ARUDO